MLLGLCVGVAAGIYLGDKITEQPVTIEKEAVAEEPGIIEEETIANEPEQKPEQKQTAKIYFTTLKDNENMMDCAKTDYVIREINDEENIAREAMTHLFAGPTEEEVAEGLQPFWINKEKADTLSRIFIKDGTAYLDWDDLSQIIPNASTSCGSASFLAPIDAILKEITGVEKVVHAINGKPAAFYEWMQMDCGEYCNETPFL